MSNPQRTGPRPGDYVEEDRGYSTPCWIWQKAKNHLGYGQTTSNYRQWPAHRFYYVCLFGPVSDDLPLDHLCRVRACVNPDHLEPVSTAENTRRGSSAKITAAKAVEIRSRIASGERQVDLAREFAISPQLVCDIKRGRKWA